jgi:hypothetical protein
MLEDHVRWGSSDEQVEVAKILINMAPVSSDSSVILLYLCEANAVILMVQL